MSAVKIKDQEKYDKYKTISDGLLNAKNIGDIVDTLRSQEIRLSIANIVDSEHPQYVLMNKPKGGMIFYKDMKTRPLVDGPMYHRAQYAILIEGYQQILETEIIDTGEQSQ